MQAQSGRILLSHAVPPTAAFSGPPYSLRWKEQDIAYRQTCFVTFDHRCRLHSVLSQGTENHKVTSTELAASSSSVVTLDIYRQEQASFITVLQADGTVTVASADLQTIAAGRLSLEEGPRTNILAAAILELPSARKSVLRARADVLGTLTNNSRIIIAALGSLDRTPGKRTIKYAVWSIEPTSGKISNRLNISHLFEHSLSQLAPELADTTIDVLSTSFGPRHAFVDLRLSRGLVRFDLQSATPRPTASLDELSSGLASHVAISQAHALAVYPGKLRILDVTYSTIQKSLDQNRKRKRGSENASAQPQLICHFSQMNRVLARDGNRLLAIDVKSIDGSDGKRNGTATLADNLSRGVATRSQLATDLVVVEEAIGGSMRQQSLSHEMQHNLSNMLEQDDIGGFENLVIEAIFSDSDFATGGPVFSDEDVSFVLSKLFSVQATTDEQTVGTRLRLNFVAPRLLEALVGRGLLCLPKLRRALRLGKEQASNQLRHDDIAKALQNADPSLALLSTYAGRGANPDVQDETLMLRFLVQQVLLQGTEAQQPRLLAAGSSEEMAVEALADTSAGERPTELSLLETCLIAVMEQYERFDVSSISSSIRSTLSSDEVFGVVQLLRQQMFRGGHTGSALAISQHRPTAQQHRVSLTSAVQILSACLDAIGPLDLIGGDDEDELIERIIPDLLSEISLATQYIEESADLQGILRETLRYAESHRPPNRGQAALRNQKSKAGRAGEISTLYSQRIEDEDINGLPSALPLSLRADEIVHATKTRKGGGQKRERSERDILSRQNRQKGPYTFERLVL